MEYIVLRATEIREENVILETKLSQKGKHSKALEEIAERITRSSTGARGEISCEAVEQESYKEMITRWWCQ